MSNDVCDVYLFDEHKVARVKANMEVVDLAPMLSIYKALADKNRLSICYSLLLEENLCVCDLANIIGATVATTSHHLRYLLKAHIVNVEKQGKNAFYELKDDHIKTLIRTALAHGDEDNVE
ncbi:ArsR/SmtB family transcription factor [Macrococcoides canis]|uniref:Metalloregulator ArsR/SmtB family transcription factor n=1 Tax=Macrococcoides canis TaxID=1855823 RepID=A0AAE6X239_9STAP|nr:metalloregulator ArsR/SmtB family transcription factor [Macrococcus canis]QCT75474.1 transcriptional regulator [Macrococcus canis]QIH76680.1 metalloregulator ArsR/SmtB family transcription factor [Macrococcus canis]QIH79116.1 metalloregulator ArsR/SmtB family transcription factor [Macrococcus canis]